MNTKTIFMLLIGTLLILTACTATRLKVPYTFEQGFEEFKKIDTKYNTSFSNEQLNGSIVAQQDIVAIKQEIKSLKDHVDDTTAQNEPYVDDAKALSLYAEIRLLMLESESYWHQGKDIGNIGLVTDPTGFRCNEAKYILEAAQVYNKSYTSALFAQRKIDDLIQYYKNVSQLRTLVGINTNKTEFFHSPLWWIKNVVRDNLDALGKNCGYKGTGFTQ